MNRKLMPCKAYYSLAMRCFVILCVVLFSTELWAGPVVTGKHSNQLRKVKGAITLTTTLTPSVLTSSAGKAQTFSTSYSNSEGYAHIKAVDLLIGAGSGVNAIWVSYDRPANKLFLYDDSGKVLTGGCTPGDAKTISNTQGSIDCRHTTVADMNGNMTVNWRITPKRSFASATARKVWLLLRDNYNRSSGWALKGNWTIKP